MRRHTDTEKERLAQRRADLRRKIGKWLDKVRLAETELAGLEVAFPEKSP